MTKKSTRINTKKILFPGIAIAVILLITVIFVVRSDQKDGAVSIEIPVRSLGPITAPVVVQEYADFGCITCRVWHQLGIIEKIQQKYGDKVRFEWHDFPVITANSPKAAEAGLCANDQGQFWKFHDVVYKNYPKLSVEDLKNYALGLGLDSKIFNECLDSGKYKKDVQQELKNGYSYGFKATPSFKVNDQVLIGPPSFEQLSAIIDELLVSGK
ncbi:MAG: DSBA oxidoreductase [Chloroflexi bacterium]|nr:MAG: DSBA oxidoreductase [Chloroflexota bacterium]